MVIRENRQGRRVIILILVSDLYVAFEDIFNQWFILLAESDAFKASRVVR